MRDGRVGYDGPPLADHDVHAATGTHTTTTDRTAAAHDHARTCTSPLDGEHA